MSHLAASAAWNSSSPSPSLSGPSCSSTSRMSSSVGFPPIALEGRRSTEGGRREKEGEGERGLPHRPGRKGNHLQTHKPSRFPPTDQVCDQVWTQGSGGQVVRSSGCQNLVEPTCGWVNLGELE